MRCALLLSLVSLCTGDVISSYQRAPWGDHGRGDRGFDAGIEHVVYNFLKDGAYGGWRQNDRDGYNQEVIELREIRKDGELKEQEKGEVGGEEWRGGRKREEYLRNFGERGEWHGAPEYYYQLPGRFGFGFQQRNLRSSGLHNPITPESLRPIGYRLPLKDVYYTPLNWRTL